MKKLMTSPKRRTHKEAVMRGFKAEDLVARLFEAMGYDVDVEPLIAGVRVDIVAEKNLRRSFVEVLAPWGGRPDINRLRSTAARLEAVAATEPQAAPIIVVLGDLTPQAREWSEHQYHLQVWDLDRIRDLARAYPAVASELLAFSSGFQPEPSTTSAAELSETSRLIAAVESHKTDNGLSATGYESLCREVFSHVFDPILYGFDKQVETTDGGNRYDFICRIKAGNDFWDGIRHDFRTRALLFECKNYQDQITADQVYSTERYLFTGALRTVCFLISRFGPDAGCRRAAQGAMREAGKLILLLSNDDLVQLLKLRTTPGGPEGHLDEMIWDFIVTLPR